MPHRNHRKRALLFLAAVLLPSAVLVGTILRLIRQERELAVRRAQEERSLLALQIGEDLVEDLLKLDDRVSGASFSPQGLSALIDSEPALLTVALAKGGALDFPWEMRSDPSSSLAPATFTGYTRHMERGEQAEFREEDFFGAARSYERAAELLLEESRGPGPSPTQSVLLNEARVHRARALYRANRRAEAKAIFLLLAESPPSSVDMDGIPFIIYGLEGLQRTGANPPELIRILRETLDRCSHFSFPALLAWRDVARDIKSGWEEESNEEVFQAVEIAVAQRVAILESLESLRSELWSLAARVRRGSGANGSGSDPIWVPYGQEPWLVGIPSDTTGGSIRVSVVRPNFLLRPARERREGTGAEGPVASSSELSETARRVTLVPVGGDGGESLGPTLNGLKASFPAEFFPPPDRGGVEGWFFRLLLPIILTLTGFTAYLAWRDVRRETEAVRLRTQFVSSVTHELKTPLTSIRMFAETLQLGRHSGPEAQREYLDTVVHETERLSRLINNVLDFARIDRGEKTYHLAPTDVGSVAREAAVAVAYPLTQGGFTLAKDIDEDLPWIEADSDALTQALLNLLSNAIKFSEKGGTISLRVLREKDNILLQVEDRGPGIAPEHQEAIFQDFYRTPFAEEAGVPGTGLGLSLVAHVAVAHGGSVEVESEVGGGSTFTILIPAAGAP